MIHARPSRRLGAALLVGIAGGVFLALAQSPWEHDELFAGAKQRISPSAASVADTPLRTRLLDPKDFGVEPGGLRDAVGGASALSMGAAGPGSLMIAVPKASGVVLGAKDMGPGAAAAASRAAKKGRRHARAIPKHGAKRRRSAVKVGRKSKHSDDADGNSLGVRPILLDDLGEEKAPKPPEAATAPDFRGLDKNIPAKDDQGATITPLPAGYHDIDGVKAPKTPPPSTEKFGWRRENDTPYYCKGSVCGRWADAHWVWMQKQDGKWWILSYSPRPDGTMGADSPAYLRHQGHWWWKDQRTGSWYVVHDGQPWSHRYLSRYKQTGLVNPETGTQMVHMPDGTVLITTPKKGADVYDGKTGAFKSHKGEDELPQEKMPDVHMPVE